MVSDFVSACWSRYQYPKFIHSIYSAAVGFSLRDDFSRINFGISLEFNLELFSAAVAGHRELLETLQTRKVSRWNWEIHFRLVADQIFYFQLIVFNFAGLITGGLKFSEITFLKQIMSSTSMVLKISSRNNRSMNKYDNLRNYQSKPSWGKASISQY